MTKQTHNTGIAQRQSVYNIVGHILDSCESERLMESKMITGSKPVAGISPIRLLYRSSPS